MNVNVQVRVDAALGHLQQAMELLVTAEQSYWDLGDVDDAAEMRHRITNLDDLMAVYDEPEVRAPERVDWTPLLVGSLNLPQYAQDGSIDVKCSVCGKPWNNIFLDGNTTCTDCIRSSKAANIANGAKETEDD